ncbi:hypothetical protein BCR39DRAFT_550279 [Naematelia encephala]|uniref:BSD domain-containing protein n=1 Tax=Naematelia encephala TaxID=71784 RepID=A0A1Y2AKE6_9TREE|nr:hypothetical protein BCR39DRAFT_550279 [Naematelia encephala]
MDQAPSLTAAAALTDSRVLADSSLPPVVAESSENAAASSSPSSDRPTSPTETIKPEDSISTSVQPLTTAQRAFQYGLDRGNLEQEVGQVMGTLNSWWGGVKKQGATALSTIKADLDKTVSQAQADIEHLRTTKIEVVRKQSGDDSSISPSDKGKSKAINLNDEAPAATSSLMDRLSASTALFQQSLQTTLAAATSNPALSNPSQLRAQLAQNLQLSSARQNLQLSVLQAEKLAEEYMRRGDQWIKDAEKWVGDAVKLLPPEGEETRFVGMDGSDFYSFSTSSNPVERGVIFDAESRTPRASVAGSRKEALLRRLRGDQELLLVDPEGTDESAERHQQFREWIEQKWPAAEGDKVQELGHVGGIRMALVPEHLSDEQFWQRYLFHKHMIEAEEERRKLLFDTSRQTQADDFSWDDEAEEVPQGMDSSTPKVSEESKMPVALAVKPDASTSTSPRDSEESYDLVSDQGVKNKAPPPGDDEDSDWE